MSIYLSLGFLSTFSLLSEVANLVFCVGVGVRLFSLNLCSCCCPGLWLKKDSFSNLVTLLKKKKQTPKLPVLFSVFKNYPSNSWILSLCKRVKWYRVKSEVFLQPSLKVNMWRVVIFVSHIFQQMGTCTYLICFFYLMVCPWDFFYISMYVYVYWDFKNNFVVFDESDFFPLSIWVHMCISIDRFLEMEY